MKEPNESPPEDVADAEDDFADRALAMVGEIFPETVALLKTLQNALTEREFLRAVLPAVLELSSSVMRQQRQPQWPPPEAFEPPDPEKLALDEILLADGVEGHGEFGGGIFGSGAALSKREGTVGDALEYVKRRVKEAHQKGVADGREAVIRESAQAQAGAADSEGRE